MTPDDEIVGRLKRAIGVWLVGDGTTRRLLECMEANGLVLSPTPARGDVTEEMVWRATKAVEQELRSISTSERVARAALEAARLPAAAQGELVCINGHDRCYEGPSDDCPYCERRHLRESLPEAEGWQTMETAPKDGSHIIVACMHNEGFLYWAAAAYWQDDAWIDAVDDEPLGPPTHFTFPPQAALAQKGE